MDLNSVEDLDDFLGTAMGYASVENYNRLIKTINKYDLLNKS